MVPRKLSIAEETRDGRQHPTHFLTGEVVGNPRKRKEGNRAETDDSIEKPPRISKMKGTIFTQHPHSTDRQVKLMTTSAVQQMSTVMLSNNDRTHSTDKSPHFCDRDTVIKSLQEGTLSTDFQGLA